ncbi:hypothetical protein B5G34_00695 [Flavonifractor sp. An82]|uniref:hypothetical protein n=1 Tax=Flavonifractor sp. An82 TaxID=1965660 RepID=UPI000B37C8EC|nr:hypothetical protein [Flavonifractor sp. An82]OUN23646.1 hypothetical protein B5G34_00695 [Flavonifractor sp. An82]
MNALFVFDEALANQLVASGAVEITTQYNIKQDVRIFDYSNPAHFCFDIDNAVKTNKCKIVRNLFMAF